LVTITLWFGISYLNDLAANLFVNAGCCRIITSADGWSLRAFLGWILAYREGADWSCFEDRLNCLIEWVLVCIASANIKQELVILWNGIIAGTHTSAKV